MDADTYADVNARMLICAAVAVCVQVELIRKELWKAYPNEQAVTTALPPGKVHRRTY